MSNNSRLIPSKMINSTWFKIVLYMTVIYVRSVDTTSCNQTRYTKKWVPSCPKSKEEWNQRVEDRKCWLVQQQCVKDEEFAYHCVINVHANQTVEVCAPKKIIKGYFCAEYNFRGARIQESKYKCNASCPFSYNSTDAYKFQECYKRVASKKRNDHSNHTSEDNPRIPSTFSSNEEVCTDFVSNAWQIVAIVMIATNVIILMLTTLLLFRRQVFKGCQERKRKRNNKEEVLEIERLLQPQTAGIYVSAIDLGDTFLNMALSDKECPEDVKPLGPFDRMCFLRDPENSTPIFGEEAFKKYINEINIKEDFHLIKLSDNSMKEADYNEALKCIMKRTEEELLKKVGVVKPSAIYYVFVVPNDWKEKAIKKLKQGVLKIGTLSKDKFCVIRRKLTLSPFIHEVNARVVCLNFNVDNLELGPDSTSTFYAILHVGSSHYDLICVKVEKDVKHDERGIPEYETHPWNEDTLPNDCILNFFEWIYEKKAIEEWKKSKDFLSFLNRWDELLKGIGEHTSMNEKFILELSQELVKGDELQAEERKARIIEKIAENKDIELVKNNWTFSVTLRWINDLFKKINSQVKTTLDHSWNDFKTKKVKCVVMTGVFSELKIIWNIAETVWFKDKKVTVVVPEDTHVFAMGGAYYGQRMNWPDASKF